MNAINFSEYFKDAVRNIIEAKNIINEADEAVSSLAQHGFVDSECGEGSRQNPVILEAVEHEVKNQLLERYFNE